jgi:DNA-binding transcriptional ArsR family regulator
MEPPAMTTDRVVLILAALGHRLRLELWRMLVPYGPRGLSAGIISSQLAIAPSSLSFHLQQMTQAGILKQRRSSRRIIYAVNSELVDDLCDFLASHSR